MYTYCDNNSRRNSGSGRASIRILSSARRIVICCMVFITNALCINSARAQSIYVLDYNLFGSTFLKTIHADTREVREVCKLEGTSSDIAFHPDGTLYCVSENKIFVLDTVTGYMSYAGSIPLKSGDGYLSGLAVHHSGMLYANSDRGYIYTFNPVTHQSKFLGKTGFYMYDIAFYEGELYGIALQYDNGNDWVEDYLIKIDLDDFSKTHKQLTWNTFSSASLVSLYDDGCLGRLISPSKREMTRFNDKLTAAEFIKVPDISYTLGAAAKTSWIGSMSPLRIDSVRVVADLCEAPPYDTRVTVFVRPGRVKVRYSIDGGNTYQDSPHFLGLGSGQYKILVTDSTGCARSDSFVIRPAPHLTASPVPASCGLANGKILVHNTDVNNPFEVSVDGGGFSVADVFEHMAPGLHTIVVRNAMGCADTFDLTIPFIPLPQAHVVSDGEHCGRKDGYIKVTSADSTLHYMLNGITHPHQGEFGGLATGVYVLTITDTLGCLILDTIHISHSNAPQITGLDIHHPHCGQNDGKISVTSVQATGKIAFYFNGVYNSNGESAGLGAGNYLLLVKDSAGCQTDTLVALTDQSNIHIDRVDVRPATCDITNGAADVFSGQSHLIAYSLDGQQYQSKAQFNDLAPGHYIAYMKDPSGCIDTQAFVITAIVPVSVSQISISPEHCFKADATLEVSAEGEGKPYRYKLDGVQAQDLPRFTGLSSGDHVVVVTDQNGCEADTTLHIAMTPAPVIDRLTVTDDHCRKEIGAVVVAATSDVGLQYSIGGSSFQSSPVFDHLKSGTYTAMVRDSYGCTSTEGFVVGETGIPAIDKVTITAESCRKVNGSVVIDAGPGFRKFDLGDLESEDGIFENLSSGSYTLVVDDGQGCITDIPVAIPYIACGVFIPNVFSPNEDGNNDTFHPFAENENMTVVLFEVYDRWGAKIYSCGGNECAWDGTIKGENIAPGVYVYRFLLRFDSDEPVEKTGSVTLMR